MRPPVDPAKVRRLLRELGRRARGPGRIYLIGGACALLEGFRHLVSKAELTAALDLIRPALLRYPAIDGDALERRVREFLSEDA